MGLPSIYILSRETAAGVLGSAAGPRITHVVSINDPEDGGLRVLDRHKGRHLVLFFHDIDEEPNKGDLVPPELEDVAAVLEFAEGIEPEHQVLVHCVAGISRSSAAALTIIASKLPPSSASAKRAVEHLMGIKQTIHPNRRMVGFADELLGYDGELLKAWHHEFKNSKLFFPT